MGVSTGVNVGAGEGEEEVVGVSEEVDVVSEWSGSRHTCVCECE